MDFLYLQNETLRLQFDRHTGALTGLTALPTGWKILDRPELGLSFRLLVPLRDQQDWHAPADRPRNNTVEGEKQSLSSYTMDPGGKIVHFNWENVVSEKGGTLPIKVTLEVRLDGPCVIFTPTVENNSDYVVENVYCPYLGDVQHPRGLRILQNLLLPVPDRPGMVALAHLQQPARLLRHRLPDASSLLGRQHRLADGAIHPYCRSENQGLYAGIWASPGSDPGSELVAWHSELRPGYGSSIDWRVSGGKPTDGILPKSPSASPPSTFPTSSPVKNAP